MGLVREPARPHDPGYPTVAEFDPRRRAALRAIGLAGLSAVGLQLVGCPGGAGTAPPPADTGTGPATDATTTTTSPATDTATSPATDTDWVPWRENEERSVDEPPSLAGGMAMPPMDQPVAIVVGGGPIEVVFSDGQQAKLAVALVVQPRSTPGSVKAAAPEHVAAVKAAARSLPSSVFASDEGLDLLGARIQEEVLKAMPGLVLEWVEAAPAYVPPPPDDGSSSQGAAPEPPARSAPSARGAPAPVAAAETGRAPLAANQVWIPCGKPGCTSCRTK